MDELGRKRKGREACARLDEAVALLEQAEQPLLAERCQALVEEVRRALAAPAAPAPDEAFDDAPTQPLRGS